MHFLWVKFQNMEPIPVKASNLSFIRDLVLEIISSMKLAMDTFQLENMVVKLPDGTWLNPWDSISELQNMGITSSNPLVLYQIPTSMTKSEFGIKCRDFSQIAKNRIEIAKMKQIAIDLIRNTEIILVDNVQIELKMENCGYVNISKRDFVETETQEFEVIDKDNVKSVDYGNDQLNCLQFVKSLQLDFQTLTAKNSVSTLVSELFK